MPRKKISKITHTKNGEPVLHSVSSDVQEFTVFEGKETIIDTMEETAKRFGSPNKAIFGVRKIIKEHKTTDMKTGKELITYEHGPMQTVTHKEYLEMAKNLSRGFFSVLKEKTMIGLCLHTCFEWVLSSHAAQYNSVTVVSSYVNLGESGIVSIIKETELDTMICPGSMISFFENLLPQCPTLKNLICVGKMEKKSKVLNLFSISELILKGIELKDQIELKYPKPDTLAFIIYTSGTTGKPKGVLHQHSNFAYGCGSMRIHIGGSEKDRHLSYLPLAHIFEIMMMHSMIFQGSFVGFGSPRTLLAKEGGAYKLGDLEAVQPTILPAVPRVFSTMKKGIEAKLKAQGGIGEKLFNSVINKRKEALKKGQLKNIFLQNVVFKKILKLFGGKLRILISGGAPLEKSIQEWFQAILYNVDFIQGYGLSETLALGTVEWPNNGWRTKSSVGEIIPCAKVKLIDVPEMNYHTKNYEGEICFAGRMVTQGYYKMPELTKETLIKDENGVIWLRTGDIGRINKDDGTLSIIDRKKTLTKVANGEYISLSQLEMVYETSPSIQPNGIYVYANSLKDYPIAICLIQLSYAKNYAKENGIELKKDDSDENVMIEELKKMINSDQFKSDLIKSFNSIADLNKLNKYERIKHVYCEFSQWTAENGLTTASFKLKRKALEEHYKKIIDYLYGDITKAEAFKTDQVKLDDIQIEEEGQGEDKKKKKIEIPKSFDLLQFE